MVDLKRMRLVDALVSLVNTRPRDNPNMGASASRAKTCESTGGF